MTKPAPRVGYDSLSNSAMVLFGIAMMVIALSMTFGWVTVGYLFPRNK